jgi:hypothetical protein
MRSRLLPILLAACWAPAFAEPPQLPVPSSTDAAPAADTHIAGKPAPSKDALDLQDIRSFTAVYSLVKQA